MDMDAWEILKQAGEMERRGIRIYKSADSVGRKWDRLLLDEGNVAVEDQTSTMPADTEGEALVTCPSPTPYRPTRTFGHASRPSPDAS